MTHQSSFNFTKQVLATLPIPEKGKTQTYRDTKESGMILLAGASGSKTFYLYKKIEGRPVRLRLGTYPDLSIENARKLASVQKGQIALGNNPQQAKRIIRDEMTFGELFFLCMERHYKPHSKRWKDVEALINTHTKMFFNRKISQIKRQEIEALHLKLKKNSSGYLANKVITFIKAIYNKSIEWGWLGINPASRIKKFPEKSRSRFIQPEEMPRFLKALNSLGDQDYQDFIWLLLLTGSRKSKVMSMKWEDISWFQSSWSIPDTKNGDTVTLPLMDKAIDLLKLRWQAAQEQAELYKVVPIFVFPALRATAGHIFFPYRKWNDLLKAAQITNLRIHDLRRTLGSYQAINGASLQIIGKSLGHRSTQATMIYARLNLDPVRESVEKATNAMFALAG